MKRKGMGAGKGKGYKNLQGRDPKIHSDSSKGRKQPQKMPNLKGIESERKFETPHGKLWISSEKSALMGKKVWLVKSDFTLTKRFDNKKDAKKYLDEQVKSYTDFYRTPDGKISDSRLSPYGKGQLRLAQGSILSFTDMNLEVVGDELVNSETKKVVQKIDNDRLVNKILFKIIGG